MEEGEETLASICIKKNTASNHGQMLKNTITTTEMSFTFQNNQAEAYWETVNVLKMLE